MIALFSILVLLDQVAKWWVLQHANSFGLVLAQNTGIAFGLFQDQTAVIVLINIAFLAAIWLLREKLFAQSRVQTLALWFILAGGVGNGFDRLARGYVVDFLQLGPIPTFNIADIWVNVGIALFLFHFLIYDRPQRT